jgi:hypothetical protein
MITTLTRDIDVQCIVWPFRIIAASVLKLFNIHERCQGDQIGSWKHRFLSKINT